MNLLIKRLLKLETSEVSDALDSLGIEGALNGISSICAGKKIAGFAFTVKYESFSSKPKEFQNAGNYIDEVPPGSIIIVDNEAKTDCTTWGNILTQMAIIKNISGTVVNGAVRDVNFINKTNYPVFSRSIFMRSGKNRVYKSAQQCDLKINNINISPGDVIFGDDNGVLVIPFNSFEDVLNRAEQVQETENKIVNSIISGVSLEESRKIHNYSKPWEISSDETK